MSEIITLYSDILYAGINKWQQNPNAIKQLYKYLPNQESDNELLVGFVDKAKEFIKEKHATLTIEDKLVSYKKYRTASELSRNLIKNIRDKDLYEEKATKIIDKDSYDIFREKRVDYIPREKDHVTLQSFLNDDRLFDVNIIPYLLTFTFQNKDEKDYVLKSEINTLLRACQEKNTIRSMSGNLQRPHKLLFGYEDEYEIFGKDYIVDFNYYLGAYEADNGYQKWLENLFKEWKIHWPNNRDIIDLIEELSENIEEQRSIKLLEYIGQMDGEESRWNKLKMDEKINKIVDKEWIPFNGDIVSLEYISRKEIWNIIKYNKPFSTIPNEHIIKIRQHFITEEELDIIENLRGHEGYPFKQEITTDEELIWPTPEEAKKALNNNIPYILSWWNDLNIRTQTSFLEKYHLTSDFGAFNVALSNLDRDSWEDALLLKEETYDSKLAWFKFISISAFYQGIEDNEEVIKFVEEIEADDLLNELFNSENNDDFWQIISKFICHTRWKWEDEEKRPKDKTSFKRRFVDLSNIWKVIKNNDPDTGFLYLLDNKNVISLPLLLYGSPREFGIKPVWSLGETLKIKSFFICRELCRMNIIPDRYKSEAFYPHGKKGLRKYIYYWGLVNDSRRNYGKWSDKFSDLRNLATKMTENGFQDYNNEYDIPFNAYHFKFCIKCRTKINEKCDMQNCLKKLRNDQ